MKKTWPWILLLVSATLIVYGSSLPTHHHWRPFIDPLSTGMNIWDFIGAVGFGIAVSTLLRKYGWFK